MVRRISGWGTRGRPFSPREYGKSHIKRSFGMSYSSYLIEYGRQYKKPSLRKYL